MKYKLLLALAVVPYLGWAQEIDRFVSDMYVQVNGDLRVVERITFAPSVKSGDMTRTIPLRFRSAYDGDFRAIELGDVEVQQEGKIASVVDSSARSHSIAFNYTQAADSSVGISYTIRGLVDSQQSHDQIVWDALDPHWGSVGQFAASIETPQSIPLRQSFCSVGAPQDDSCSVPSRTENNRVAYFAHLEPTQENLYITARFGDGVGGKIIAARWTWWETALVTAGGLLALLVLWYLLVRMTTMWRHNSMIKKQNTQKHD